MKSRRLALAIMIAGVIPFRTQVASSHAQPVHQYIVHEAYLLLIAQHPELNTPELAAHIGEASLSFTGDSAWQMPYITTGAWREDEEDVVFHYDFYGVEGIKYPLVSITHFWPADNGAVPKRMEAHELQVLLAAGNPETAQAAPASCGRPRCHARATTRLSFGTTMCISPAAIT